MAKVFPRQNKNSIPIPIPVIQLAWEQRKVAEDWNMTAIVSLHKKGSYMVYRNYWGISLLNIPSSKTDNKVLEVQRGLRQKRGCGR